MFEQVRRLANGGRPRMSEGDASPGPSGWRIEGTVSTGPARDPAPSEADVPVLVDDPQRWTEASETVQTTAKWVIGALAAVGTVMFAKGIVSTPKLSVSENRGQLLVAGLLGVLGVLGIVSLIGAASTVLLPYVVRLGSLPAAFKAEVESKEGRRDYLPADVDTVEVLRSTIDGTYIAIADNADRIEELEHPVPGLTSEEEAARAVELRIRRNAQAGQKRDLTVLLRKRAQLLDAAQYWVLSNKYSVSSTRVLAGAVLAAVGGLGFQLALATPDPSAAKAADASTKVVSRPTVGDLVQLDTAASRQLWDAVQLSGCEVPGQPRPTVRVVVLAGEGTSDHPYTVSPLSSVPDCPAVTFNVIDAVAQVTLRVPIEITYSTPTTGTSSPTKAADQVPAPN